LKLIPLHLLPALFAAFSAAAILTTGLPKQAGAQRAPNPQAGAIIQSLSDDERQKFFAMSPEEKRKFIQQRLAQGGASNGSGGRGAQAGPNSGGGRPGGGPGGGRFPPPLVELANVEREVLFQTIPITGRLVATQKSTIASRITGRISNVLVDVGDRVEKDQALAEIELGRFKLEADLKGAEVVQARAKLRSTEAQVDFLKQELKRLEGLRSSAAFSQARYEDKKQEIVKAQTAVDEAKASLTRAQAAWDLAKLDVNDAVIRAPFAGVVTLRNVSAGAFVNGGSAILTLLDDRTLEVEADIPSDRLGGLEPGNKVTVLLNRGDEGIDATVRAIVPDEDPLARTRAVRLTPDFGSKASNVVANQSVTVAVPRGEPREVISVPKDAIVNQQTGPVVFVFQDGRVRPAQVRIGDAFASKFEILSGLTPGQQVVVRGNELLRPGQPVRVAPSDDDQDTSPPPGMGNGAGSPAAGPIPQARSVIQNLSDEERQKFFALSGPEKRAFIEEKLRQQQDTGREKVGTSRPMPGAAMAAEPPTGRGGPPPAVRAIIESLSHEERQKFFSLGDEERRAFIREKLQQQSGG